MEGRKEVERFVGQLREFGGNGRFNRRSRRTGRLVLGAALFGAALLVLTACSGDAGSYSLGESDDSATEGSYDLHESGDSATEESTTSISTVPEDVSLSEESTGFAVEESTGFAVEESTGPISPVCQPPDMEGCYDYEDMQAYLDQIIPMVEQFSDAAYADMPPPEGLLLYP